MAPDPREYDERAAVLWQTRTRPDLDALVADLPSAHRPAPVPATPGAWQPPRRVVAVLSEDRLEVPIAPGQRVQAHAVLGTARVDLRRDDLPAQVHVTATCVLGEVEILVPRGAAVHLSGLSVLGERSVKVEGGAGPVIHVDAYAVLGTVTVRHGKQRRGAAGTDQLARTGGGEVSSGRPGRWRTAAAALAVVGVLGAGAVGLAAAGQDGRVIFGSSDVNAQEGQDLRVSMLFGSMRVVVPDDVRVRTTGTVIFGSVECETACRSGGSGELIEVRTVGGFGSVEVLTESEAERADDGPGG